MRLTEKIVAAAVVLAAGCSPSSNASSGAATPNNAATAPPAASATVASAPPPAPSPADPQDAPLAAFVKDVGQTLVNAATGKPVDARWNPKDASHAVTMLSDDDKKSLEVLGKDLKIVLVEMEVGEVARPDPANHFHVNGRAVLLADGTLRWGTPGSRHQESETQEPTPGLSKSAPAVVAGGARMIKALAGDCKLPWVAPSDVAQAPPSVQSEFVANMTHVRRACDLVASVHGEWRPHIDDVRVLVSGNGHFAFLKTVFDVDDAESANGQRLTLSPLEVEVLPDAQLTNKKH